jgi:transcriptional regulator of acetoin/glycerol metabolism
MLTGPENSRPLTSTFLPQATNSTLSVRAPMDACQANPRSLSAITRCALADPERAIIHAALEANNWGRQDTARSLDINRTTLIKK